MIVVLMGVTSSGKTTVGKVLATELGWRFYDADDYHPPKNIEKMRRDIPLTDEDRKPWLQTPAGLIDSARDRGENIVLAARRSSMPTRNTCGIIWMWFVTSASVDHRR
jgi:gluconokinase